jgi:pre-rRNA-processing protein RIX1
MCIITLTRIFHLTYQYPTLVREITTPSLPAFINSALNLVSVKSSSEPTRKLKPNAPLLEPVLHALLELIARHPTIFRPFSAQIHSLLVVIIGSSPSAFFSSSVKDLAEQLFISLHNCAPKNTSGEEWKSAIKLVIISIHRTTDHVYRAVAEQWESVDPSLRQATKSLDYSQEVGDSGPDPLGLPGWQGINSGAERLVTLLRLLSAFLSTPTASTVAVPAGSILDLTSRLTSVTVPPEGLDASHAQLNPQIGREERDNLWAELPRIHVACMDLLQDIVYALETSIFPATQNILEQGLWAFRAENFNRELRMSTYDLTRSLLCLTGPSMTKQNVSSLSKLFRSCCRDLLNPAGDAGSSTDSSNNPTGKSKTNQGAINADSFLNPALSQGRRGKSSSSFPGLVRAASELLPTVLTDVPTEFLSPSIRAEIDRTIILASEKNAMVASVLNPIPATTGRGVAPSIMPFLARSYAGEMEVEGLIRPRMPVLINTPDLNGYANVDEEEDEEEVDDASGSMYPEPSGSTGFLNTSLPAVPDAKPTSTTSGEEQAPASNKRSHAEEPDSHASGAPSAVPEQNQEEVQTKKARVTEDVTIPSKPSIEETSSVPLTREPTSSVQEAPTSATPAPVQQISNEDATSAPRAGISVPATAVPKEKPSTAQSGEPNGEAADESDDELPTLNLEPDTDDEEDDVAMDG